MLRLDAGRHPDDPLLSELTGDLALHSREFARWWSAHRVHQRTSGTEHYRHPMVGDLTVDYQALTINADPDQTLIVYRAEPGSPSAAALQLLRLTSDRGTATHEGDHAEPASRRSRSDGRKAGYTLTRMIG